MQFNPAPATIMHIDINSCFASIEQQANPLFRGHPLVVAAYTTDRGCILAASREAKKLGIKTGMRVFEGKNIYPRLIVLPSDPPKYRFVNHALLALLQQYCADVEVQSIDEMVLQMNLESGIRNHEESKINKPIIHNSLFMIHEITNEMFQIANEIKKRITSEIGEWLTVSIGISTNHYLAKIASNLHKTDGLDMITVQNIEHILCSLKLEELTGIKEGYGRRLRTYGIDCPLAMYRASGARLAAAFDSKIGYDWQLMLHGWDPTAASGQDRIKSIGHSYALPKSYLPTDVRLHQILSQLVEKMGRRLRDGHFSAGGIRIATVFNDHTYWNHGEKLVHTFFANHDLYYASLTILNKAPKKPVKLLAVSSYFLADQNQEQLDLFDRSDRKRALTQALDAISDRWGEFTVTPARMLGMEHRILDRIAFGGVR